MYDKLDVEVQAVVEGSQRHQQTQPVLKAFSTV